MDYGVWPTDYGVWPKVDLGNLFEEELIEFSSCTYLINFVRIHIIMAYYTYLISTNV